MWSHPYRVLLCIAHRHSVCGSRAFRPSPRQETVFEDELDDEDEGSGRSLIFFDKLFQLAKLSNEIGDLIVSIQAAGIR